MRVSLIAAMDERRLIGVENRLPWKLPADMQWFRRHTLGKAIIMGRKTFESLGCRPLPGRQNYVLSTKSPTSLVADVHFASSIDNVLQLLQNHEEVMIIGGATFYEQMLPHADRLYVTIVHHQFTGDAYFPDYTQYHWKVVLEEHHQPDEKNAYAYSFYIFDRVSK